MNYLNINFSGGKVRYWRRPLQRRYFLINFFILIGLTCCLSLSTYIYLNTIKYHELLRLQEKLKHKISTRPTTHPTKQTLAISAEKIPAINLAISKLNLPWRDLFDSIEQATPKNIALISLEPDGIKKTLVIIAEATNAHSMLNYLENLNKQPLFTQVILVKHEINKQDSNSPYRFQLEAQWKDRAP